MNENKKISLDEIYKGQEQLSLLQKEVNKTFDIMMVYERGHISSSSEEYTNISARVEMHRQNINEIISTLRAACGNDDELFTRIMAQATKNRAKKSFAQFSTTTLEEKIDSATLSEKEAIEELLKERALNEKEKYSFSKTQTWVVVISTVIIATCTFLGLVVQLSGVLD